MSSPFDYVKAINETKVDMFQDPQAESEYLPFLVNRALSNFTDTIFYANEMNRMSGLPKIMQFHYLINIIAKKKRYGSWSKPEKESSSIALVKEYYKYSNEKAIQALRILTDDDLAIIEQKMNKGGR
jgi:hypothetical protein